MEVQDERARDCNGRSFRRRGIFILVIGVLALMLGLGGTCYYSWALQKYTIAPGERQGLPSPAAPQQRGSRKAMEQRCQLRRPTGK